MTPAAATIVESRIPWGVGRAGRRALRFLPLALIAGPHGFVLAGPYLLLVMLAAACVRTDRWAKAGFGPR